MKLPLPIPLLLLAACSSEPDPCDAFCALAAEVQTRCLEQSGLYWSATGYEDEDDYAASCRTWAWEQRLLARDAGEDEGQVGETCEAHQADLEEGECAALTAIDWEAPAWERP